MNKSNQPHRAVTFGVIAAALALLSGSAKAAQRRGAADYYNEGVSKLRGEELRDAEAAFVQALRSNEDAIQPDALYNLGHVRFLQGRDTLKGGSDRGQLLGNADTVATIAEEAIRNARGVLESEDVQELINAYLQGRAARKQLRSVNDETTRQLDLIASALQRWRRSVGDFRGAKQLDAANTDAAFNADTVERHIAELLKFQKQVQQAQEGNQQKREELRKLMKEIGGKIPDEFKRGSDDEESDEDEDGKEPQDDAEPKTAGQQQQRIGRDREIHPDMLKLLKEKIEMRTMSPAQEQEKRGSGGDRPDDTKRKGRDY